MMVSSADRVRKPMDLPEFIAFIAIIKKEKRRQK